MDPPHTHNTRTHFQNRGKQETHRSLWLTAKSIRANVRSSLTRTQGLKMSLLNSQAQPLCSSFHPLGHPLFVEKGSPGLLQKSLFSLLPACRSFRVQRPLIILYWFCPLSIQAYGISANLLLLKTPGISYNSYLGPLRQDHTHKLFKNKPFLTLGFY